MWCRRVHSGLEARKGRGVQKSYNALYIRGLYLKLKAWFANQRRREMLNICDVSKIGLLTPATERRWEGYAGFTGPAS